MVVIIVISSELNLLISTIIFSVSIVFVFVCLCLCFSYLFLIYNTFKQVANIKQKKTRIFFPGLCWVCLVSVRVSIARVVLVVYAIPIQLEPVGSV